nr:ryanodine receptor 3-like [Oncorhynchus nerka]
MDNKDDEVVLQSVATIQKENRKFCLSVEGLGNRLCFLEPTSEAKYVPPDLCICCFILEQSLSVRALQEMLAHTVPNNEGKADHEQWSPRWSQLTSAEGTAAGMNWSSLGR